MKTRSHCAEFLAKTRIMTENIEKKKMCKIPYYLEYAFYSPKLTTL